MRLTWIWPWAALAGVMAAVAVIVIAALALDALERRREARDRTAVSFSLDDDLNMPTASRLFRLWRWLGRAAMLALAAALAVSLTLVARPATVDRGQEQASSRDIILCLDVSGSTLPYDREVIDTYLDLVSRFEGERIGLSIFNSTSRTVFPLTDDYELVTDQLKSASDTLRGVESQDDIDDMSDQDYQRISDWLDGTQNRKDTTSLIGDGLVSCAAMLPGFAYGSAGGNGGGSDDSDATSQRRRAASIVLATDNVVSGSPTYSLEEALDLTRDADITVDGFYSGPANSEGERTTTDMRAQIESHGGLFTPRSNTRSVEELVRDIDSRRQAESEHDQQAAVTDTPGWLTLALAILVAAFLVTVWRLRR